MKLPMVCVWWEDAYERPGYFEHGSKITPCVFPGVGIMVRKDAKHIVLAHIADEEEYAGEFVIPRALVRKIDRLGMLTLRKRGPKGSRRG